jgi:hypothetical protein
VRKKNDVARTGVPCLELVRGGKWAHSTCASPPTTLPAEIPRVLRRKAEYRRARGIPKLMAGCARNSNSPAAESGGN